MSLQNGRYPAGGAPHVAEGWSLTSLTQPSRLFGANGMRTGPDGRIYVAQVSGSQISAIDVASGAVEAISPMGGAIVGPDDLVFDPDGNLYATEITEGRVSMLTPKGETRVIAADMPVANPITFHKGQLIAGECRPGGRIMQLDLNGGAPRVIVADVPMPNAMDVGPDGKLYFPVMGTNEIWRVSLAGGPTEKVAGDLGVPDSVKFDSKGFIISTQVYSGQVLRIDPRSGDRTVLATLTPGLDNSTFVGERLFVSSITGFVTEILADGKTRDLVPEGLNWPLGLAMDADGVLFIADGAFSYELPVSGGARRIIGMLFSPGYPGYTRGVAAVGPGEFVVTTASGEVKRYWPAKPESATLAEGFDQLYGVAVAPSGAVIFAEQGKGRVHSVHDGNVEMLASGLRQPSGIALGGDGSCYVAESGGGRVVKLARGTETVVDGLQKPQGILVRGSLLYVVDAGAKELIEVDLASRGRRVIAAGLPIGAPPGVVPKFLGPIGNLAGAMGPFAGITAGADGTLYVSGDANGSVLAVGRV